MSKIKANKKRKSRTTHKLKKRNKSNRPILTVFRSNKNFYAQIIDLTGKVLVTFSSKSKELAGKLKGKTGIEVATLVGEGLAKAAAKAKIKEVVFNKGPYLYSGRVKAFCEAARKNGLLF